WLDHAVRAARRSDGLYHAYNLARFTEDGVEVDHLYPMLEGQVAALSSGLLTPEEAADVLDALYESPLYREDQRSFLLYPDRELPGFLERNRVPEEAALAIPLLRGMLGAGDVRIVLRDADGRIRF